MKHFFLGFFVGLALAPSIIFAASSGDLVLSPENIRFSIETFLEGKKFRIYASVTNTGSKDLRGVVKFFDNKNQIQGDQPISVLAGKEDAVFVDLSPSAGGHQIKVLLSPFEEENDNPANNVVEKNINVLADTDRDGIPNASDPDDDNDKVPDSQDAFPLNKNESVDSDGDTTGDNQDDDDDNDGVKDKEDALPLNANETLDTDQDGIGNNEDLDDDGDRLSDSEELGLGTDPLKTDTDGDTVNDKEDAYPLDSTQARDFDRDGISDTKDADADNDGIPKTEDINDTNLGPNIFITTEKKPHRRIISPHIPITFETNNSRDPDGNIKNIEWEIEGEKTSGEILTTTFESTGFKKITVRLTDDKGESREKTFTVFVTPTYLPWLLGGVLLLLLILAFFLIFHYSKRRI